MTECPEGEVFVGSYSKRDGTFVRGYCRPARPHEEVDDDNDLEEDTEDFAEL